MCWEYVKPTVPMAMDIYRATLALGLCLGHQLTSARHSGKTLPQSLMILDNSMALDPVSKLTNLLVPSGIQCSQNCHWQGC